MEQIANVSPPPAPKTKSTKHIWGIVLVVVLSTLVGASYFYYTRLLSPSLKALSSLSQENDTSDSSKFIFEEAQISFLYPPTVNAIEIDSGISISEEGTSVMDIKYGKLIDQSLSDFVENNSDSNFEITNIGEKIGLEVMENNTAKKYFPLYDNSYVVFEIYTSNESTNFILDNIEFIAPSEAMRR